MSKALTADAYFTVAKYQQAMVAVKSRKWRQAMEYLIQCHKLMRNNKLVKYGSLGMDYTLYAHDVL